jgi:tRNA threonylcarbamoyladenosine biosynthesis protein TsaB
VSLILNIETSSPICSVCLAKNSEVLMIKEDTSGNSHAKLLTVFIDELFKSCKISMHELDAVAISAGPGSYTGLRIGTSVAKGLCYALDKPLIAVPTLQSLAFGMKKKPRTNTDFFLPLIDARRMDVYLALYDNNLNEKIPASFSTIDNYLLESLNAFEKIQIGGTGAKKFYEQASSSKFQLTSIECSAEWMATVAQKKLSENCFENTAYYEPFYLKEFVSKH